MNQLTASHLLAVHGIERSTAHRVTAGSRGVKVTRVKVVVEVDGFTRSIGVTRRLARRHVATFWLCNMKYNNTFAANVCYHV